MTIPDAAKLERYDDLANTVEELHDENMLLRQAIKQTLDENGHLADGEVCTLLPLKLALRKIGVPWQGDELPNVELTGLRRPYGEGPVERHVGRQNGGTE